MFQTVCIPAVISKATLKREMDDEESYRVADVSIVIEPFSQELADELGEHVGRHLFDALGMRPEVEDITIGLRVPSQRVIVASAPDAPTLAELKDVRIGDLTIVRKAKGDRDWFRATVAARIDLRERVIREFLFHHFGELRRFTFVSEQMDMPFHRSESSGDSSEATRH